MALKHREKPWRRRLQGKGMRHENAKVKTFSHPDYTVGSGFHRILPPKELAGLSCDLNIDATVEMLRDTGFTAGKELRAYYQTPSHLTLKVLSLFG